MLLGSVLRLPMCLSDDTGRDGGTKSTATLIDKRQQRYYQIQEDLNPEIIHKVSIDFQHYIFKTGK